MLPEGPRLRADDPSRPERDHVQLAPCLLPEQSGRTAERVEGVLPSRQGVARRQARRSAGRRRRPLLRCQPRVRLRREHHVLLERSWVRATLRERRLPSRVAGGVQPRAGARRNPSSTQRPLAHRQPNPWTVGNAAQPLSTSGSIDNLPRTITCAPANESVAIRTQAPSGADGRSRRPGATPASGSRPESAALARRLVRTMTGPWRMWQRGVRRRVSITRPPAAREFVVLPYPAAREQVT